MVPAMKPAMKSLILTLILACLPVVPVWAEDWALDGYDPVGYLAAGQAQPGRSDLSTMWQGQVWHFVSEQNRAAFESDPKAYAPAFGGFCPVTLAEGRQEKGDPRYFSVIERRVYLLRSDAALREFNGDPQQFISLARRNWGGD